jgi:hypothetical protein
MPKGGVSMAQLTKGMYGDEFGPTSNLFGLYCGQMRGGPTKLTHNSGWYNRRGEKLGWGDMSKEDFRRISRDLEDGELFIIISEQDSFWRFVTRPGIIGRMAKVRSNIDAPGVKYVVEHAMFIIAKGQLYYVDRYNSSGETLERVGLHFKVLTPEAAEQLIAG